MSLWSRMANVFHPDRLNRDIEEELASHVAEAIEQGRDPEEARRAFGRTATHQQQSHDIHVINWLESLRADIIFGWRQLKAHKITSFAAILSLALAIGACTSAFRLIDALFLRPLPIAHADRLYLLSRKGMGFDNKPGEWDSWAYPLFTQMRGAVKDQADLVAVFSTGFRTDLTYKTDQEMEKANLAYVSGDMFDIFGLQPALGRLLTASDDRTRGADTAAVISYDYWTRRFARDPHVIGKIVRIGDDLFQIVGVSEKKFTGTEPGAFVDIFVPSVMHRCATRSDCTWIRIFIVLHPDVAPEPLRQKLAAMSHAFEVKRLSGETGLSAETLKNVLANQVLMTPAPNGVSGMQATYGDALVALGVLVFMVLLIACANVANLMTAQAAARAREMALRVSIGAGRGRLIQMVLVESALLAIASAIGGALFAWWSAPFVISGINPPDNPARLDLPADWRVLLFAIALTLAVVLLFGLLPALRASSVQPASILKGGDDPHSRRRLMQGMVAAQVAFCFLVLFIAGLFVATFKRLSNQPLGFSPDRLLVLETTSRPAQPQIYWDQIADHLRSMPGVERVAQSGWELMSGSSWNGSISLNGGPPSTDLAYFLSISPGWLDTMKVPLLAGRDFRNNDAYPNVAIVNQTFARKFLNDEYPVGRFFEKSSDDGKRDRMQVVGVVRDSYYSDIHSPILPVVYVPLHYLEASGKMLPLDQETFIVRTTSSNPLALASTLRQEVPRVRAQFHVSNIRTQQEIDQAQTIRERLLAMLAFFFGSVALLLAGIGLYGVLNYSLLQRERELGIRLALGARAAHIAREVTAGIASAVLLGAIAGLALGMASARWIASLLYQVKATDPAMLALPWGILLLTAAIAAVPAILRALHIDPVAMLRAE
jgi:putative ABC transport system permease protein